MADALFQRAWIAGLLGALLAACGAPPGAGHGEFGGGTMGTTYRVVLGSAAVSRTDLQAELEGLFAQVEALSSTYRPDSALSRFNRNPSTDWIEVPTALCEAVDRTLEISRLTDGAFDVTVGPLVNLWGFGPDGMTDTPPGAEAVAEARERVGFRKLHTRCADGRMRKDHPKLSIDLSAWAKGQAVDLAAAALDRHAVADYMVEIGGEIRVRGRNARGRPWAIAIEQPGDGDRGVNSVVYLTAGAVATSGDYRNFFVHQGNRYSHAMDARSGLPVNHAAASVTVLNNSAATADALATALLVLGPEAGLAFSEQQAIASYFLIRSDRGIEARASSAFDAVPQS